jgi:hypothetical protein
MLHTRLIKISRQLIVMTNEAIFGKTNAISLLVNIARRHIYFWMKL